MRDAGALGAGTTGIVSFVGNNASFFTVILALIGTLIAIAGHLWKRKIDRERREEEKALHNARMAVLREEMQ